MPVCVQCAANHLQGKGCVHPLVECARESHTQTDSESRDHDGGGRGRRPVEDVSVGERGKWSYCSSALHTQQLPLTDGWMGPFVVAVAPRRRR